MTDANALRLLAREQGDLLLACYAEALRVHEEMDGIDEQNENGGVTPADAEAEAEPDPPAFEEADDEAVDPVLETAIDLYRGACARINAMIQAGPETAAKLAVALSQPTPTIAPPATDKRRAAPHRVRPASSHGPKGQDIFGKDKDAGGEAAK